MNETGCFYYYVAVHCYISHASISIIFMGHLGVRILTI